MILLEVNRSVYLSTCNFFPNKSDTVLTDFQRIHTMINFQGNKKAILPFFTKSKNSYCDIFFYVTLYKSINKKLEILYFHFSPTFKLPIMIMAKVKHHRFHI